MPENTKFLSELFLEAVDKFLQVEVGNILNGVSERNLCARLAFILESDAKNAGLQGYYADTEYNRKQEGAIKTILDDKMEVVQITCDLILHSRGERVIDDNLIAIEMKRAAHSHLEKQKDRIRLRAMTKSSYDDLWSADGEAHPEHVCGYSVGYFIELDAKKRIFHIEEYQRGKMVSKSKLTF